jgi:hypothetical protein
MATPPVGDLYEELGVARSASREQIAAAYRARAKQLHPDARPDDATAAERFTRLGAAYRVLSDAGERARYDAALARPVITLPSATPVSAPSASPPRPPVRPAKPFRLSRRGARWAAWGGAALVLVGLVVGALVLSLQRHDADLRANGVAATAVVVQVGGERRLEFQTTDGRVVRATEPVKTGEGQPAVGSRVAVHYDRNDPTSIVTDESHTGRDITLWIVAVKFVVGGSVLTWFGVRRLRRA